MVFAGEARGEAAKTTSTLKSDFETAFFVLKKSAQSDTKEPKIGLFRGPKMEQNLTFQTFKIDAKR